MLNNVSLVGRLVADPETRYTPSGKAVSQFNLAVQRPGKDAPADFIGCQIWDSAAEVLGKHGGKGQIIAVTGQLRQEKWTDESGAHRSKTVVNCYSMRFVGGKSNGQKSEQQVDDVGGGYDEIPF